MNAPTDVSVRQVAFSFGAGALFMGLLTIAGTALAQAPSFLASDMQLMLEWCRQMMGQAGSAAQAMISGLCMMSR